MKRISTAVLWGGLVFTLAIGVAPAQLINEIVRGAANGVPTDMFGCGTGNASCDLGYKLYCDLDPSDTSGSANPTDGIPSYRSKASRYLADSQITGNYPVCGTLGGGNNWYMLFDGQTGGGTAAHAGWYGGQAQVINFNEIGNSLSFNCLPIIAAEACFAALDERTAFNDTTLRDGSALVHQGGISPVPAPQVSYTIDTVTAVWEEAVNQTVRDGAVPAVAGVDLYWMADDANATDADWGANGQLLASLPADGTSFDIVRGDPFLQNSPFMLATKVTYAGGHASFFSANSRAFGDTEDLEFIEFLAGESSATSCASQAPAIVLVDSVGVGIRVDDFGKEFLIVLVDIVGSPEGQVRTPSIDYVVTMNSPGAGRSNRQVRARALTGQPVQLRFNTNFDNTGEPDRLLTERSTFDNINGQIIFGIPLAELQESFIGGAISNPEGSRVITLTGRVAVPGAQDQWPSGGGELSFTF
jgi:hypothetical protein